MEPFTWDTSSHLSQFSCTMNSSAGNEANSYYECPAGGSITPTVVSNFNLPNSHVNKEGPYLKIKEQPQTKFRFRYKSEMVGTHGQLKAESSDKNKSVFPTVQLCNWKGGPALVRLTLYTAEDNANERKRHVHELNGKNCNKEGFTGGCEVVVDEENNYTAQFPNLGIIHIAKRDVQNIIFLRKKEELVNHTCRNNPGLRTESIQHNIPPTKLQKLKEEAEEEARNMDLNKVVLRFQTFFFDNKSNFYRPITDYVDSDVIFNLKNASTGELKIVRMSAVSCPSTGGSEVWMLVEKVKKNNVRIKFYELDHDGREVWKSYGEFKESDVHHQYAIVFRTPPYRFTNIREPVHVKVQLERTTDNDTSEPLVFSYVPENLKRSNAFLDSKIDFDINPQKRAKHTDDVMDLKKRSNLFLGSGGELKQPYSSETPNQSPPHMVPSPMTPDASPSSQVFYSPPHQSVTYNPSITVSNDGDEFAYCTEDSMRIPLENHIGQQNTSSILQGNYLYQVVGGEKIQNGCPPATGENDQNIYFHHSYYNNQMLSPYQQVPSPSNNEQGSPQGGQLSPFSHHRLSPSHAVSTIFDQNIEPSESDNALAQIQQFDAFQKQVISRKTEVMNMHQWDFSDLVNSPSNQVNNNGEIDLLDIISDTKLFAAPKDFGDIQADCAPCQGKTSPKGKKREGKEVDILAEKFSKVSMTEDIKHTKEKQKREKLESQGSITGKDQAFKSAMTVADCLQSYLSTGDISLLLATHRYLLTMQNNQGNNSIHNSILNKDKEAFNKIFKVSSSLFCWDLLTDQNSNGETPLHLAVRSDETDMVKRLLMTPGCNINIVDVDGNTPLHLASEKTHHLCLAVILLPFANNKEDTKISEIINQYNYHGQTPLHMAVTSGCLESVKLLLKCGALIHLCERKRGANSLHLAVRFGQHDIARYLIKNTSITVDAGLLDGNTALHIAAQSKDKEMCSILMAGKANPYAKNSLYAGKNYADKTVRDEENEDFSEEDTDEEEKNESGYTPVDYAQNDAEVLAILCGLQSDSQAHINNT